MTQPACESYCICVSASIDKRARYIYTSGVFICHVYIIILYITACKVISPQMACDCRCKRSSLRQRMDVEYHSLFALFNACL